MNPGSIQKPSLEICYIDFFCLVVSNDEDPFSRTRNIGKDVFRPDKLRIAILRYNIFMKPTWLCNGRTIRIFCSTWVPALAVCSPIITYTRVRIKHDDVDNNTVAITTVSEHHSSMIITRIHNPPRNCFVERELRLRRESIIVVA